jgi:hypothetical protein
MLKGYNSDVCIKGIDYHVQTEDWGETNPFLVTRVFRHGCVLKTFKIPYSSILPHQHYDSSTLEQALKLQHFRILDQIMQDPLG